MKKKWLKLDTAALVFPAMIGRGWSCCFRMSFNLKEEVDPICLLKALNDLKPRFPSFFVKLKRGVFWYYLEENKNPVKPIKDFAYPLTYMSSKDLSKSCIRVLYFENRVAVEFFHSVTDGTGAMIFMKNLAARYIFLKYKVVCDLENEVFDINEEPKSYEIEDCFHQTSNNYPTSRKEPKAYHYHGHLELNLFKNLITGIVPTDKLLEKSHEYGVTATSFLAGILTESYIKIQEERVKERKQKPVKISIAVNLRKVFKKETFRNFVLALNIGVDPRCGTWKLNEICDQINHQLKMEIVPQKMAGRVASNVLPQKNLLVRFAPIAIKNIVLKAMYIATGEKTGTISLSNLGQIRVPKQIEEYVDRFEFILPVQQTYTNNVGVTSYKGNTYLNFIRNCKETDIEKEFFRRLVELGIPVEVESNKKGEK